MQKLFSTLAMASGTAAVILSAWLYFNRTDTHDAVVAEGRARQELQQLDFDEDFARRDGTPMPAERQARATQRRKELEQVIARAQRQQAGAEAARHKAADTLDNTLAEMDRGTIKTAADGPGPLAALVAGVILLAIGLGLRLATRASSQADDEKAPKPLRALDRMVDRMATLRKQGATSKGGESK